MAKIALTPNQQKIIRLIRQGRKIEQSKETGRVYLLGHGKIEHLGYDDIGVLQRAGYLTPGFKQTKAMREGKI